MSITARCSDCDKARGVTATGGFRFIGCYNEPYHGKPVVEIKDCPKNNINICGVTKLECSMCNPCCEHR